MKAILLHLSDGHINSKHGHVANRHQAIAATMRPLYSDASHVFVVFTGDIVNAGSQEEFKLALSFLSKLKENIAKEFTGPICIITAPGNHDGAFKESKTTRNRLIKGLGTDANPEIDDDLIEDCTEPLQAYYDFVKELGCSGQTYIDKLWQDYRYNIGETTLRFSSMNASWISTVPESKGSLVFPVDRYQSLQEEPGIVNILLMHHPLNWYAQSAYHPLRELVKSSYQIVMSGHEHTSTTSIITDVEKHSTIFFEAPALEKDDKSSFSVLLLDTTANTIAQEIFSWRGDLYQTETAQVTWANRIKIPKHKPKNGFHLTDRAKVSLESMDAAFSHPMQEVIHLSDVFVPPDLLSLDSDGDDQDSLSATVLLEPKPEYDYVLIYGDEQYGKTSLLKHWHQEYMRQGLKPLMFDAKDASGNSENFLRVISRQVVDTYGAQAETKFLQLPASEKVALVDNLEALGSRGDVISRVVKNLEGQFGRVVILASERYEVMTISSTEAVSALREYKQLRMQGFGYKLRHDLIRRWYAIGHQLSESEFQAKVHAADQAINSVLSKGLVAMTAFNTLVLLQSMEVNERGSLANAGTAQYYEYMFRHSLLLAKVKADEFDEIQSYLVHMAWSIFSQKAKSLTSQAIQEFNLWFSKKVHPTDLVDRLRLLEESKILVRRNGDYAFAFPYLEYFFVAKYLADNLEEQPELRDKITHLCKHIYLKENANIVLFLTHHLNGNWFIREIADLLSAILNDVPVMRLETDAEVLNMWVTEKAKLIVDTSNLDENNRESRKNDDKSAKLPEVVPEKEVASIYELDSFTQLNLLFKTSEILGQVLKGRYGSIGNELKIDLLNRLFDAPLRGVSFFSSIINSEPEAVLLEVTTRLHRHFPSISREKIDRVAKRFLFGTLGAVADAFVSRQGEIIGSPKLTAIIDQTAADNGGLSYRVIATAAKLSYPGAPPIDEIRDLAKDLDSNFFGWKLLQGLVARHLYMFHVPHTEKMQLAAAVKIDVRTQRDIEIKSHTTKKLPGQQQAIPKHSVSLLSRLQNSFLLNNKASLSAVESRYKSRVKKNSG